MRGVGFFVVVGLLACAMGDPVSAAGASSEPREWRTTAGPPPSENEFAAVLAACEDRAKSANKSGPIEGCLADYGLRRVQ
jgi:hypothetical protein